MWETYHRRDAVFSSTILTYIFFMYVFVRPCLFVVCSRSCSPPPPSHPPRLRPQAGETEQEGALLKSMVKRYKHARKVWLRYETYLLQRGEHKAASETLQRSLKSLEKHKHVRAIVQVGTVHLWCICGVLV